jgi:hypothetical protein
MGCDALEATVLFSIIVVMLHSAATEQKFVMEYIMSAVVECDVDIQVDAAKATNISISPEC